MNDDDIKLLKKTYGFEEFWCPLCKQAIVSIFCGVTPMEFVLDDDVARKEKECYGCTKVKRR